MTTAAEDRSGILSSPGRNRSAWQRAVAVVRRPHPAVDHREVDTVEIRLLTSRVVSYETRPQPLPHVRTADAPFDAVAVIERIQTGGRTVRAEAFGQFYDHYQTMVYKFVCFRVSHRQLAEDLTADTFLRALKSVDKFTWKGRDPGAWLVTIARNLIADYYKAASTRLERPIDDLLEADRPDPRWDSIPETVAVDQDTNRILMDAIRRLTTEQQEVIALRFLHGFSVAETAQALDKRDGAIKALQYRAVKALQQLLPDGFRS